MSTSTPLDLHPGDVLLHMGKGEISKLIAWASNSRYSHAALVLDSDSLIEATASGVRIKALAPRLVERDEFVLIDGWRFKDGKGSLSTDHLGALQARARSFLGAPYPLDQLFELGIICALRSKLDWPEPLKWLLRVALDRAVQADPSRMVCSEFVYRSFAEATTEPPGALRPVIEVVDTPELPFPDIDWLALLKEYEQARHSTPLPAAPHTAPLQLQASGADPEHIALAEEIRRRRQGPVKAIVDPWPNPETVTPEDFATSPSFWRASSILS